MSPREMGAALAASQSPASPEAIEAAARILASVELEGAA